MTMARRSVLVVLPGLLLLVAGSMPAHAQNVVDTVMQDYQNAANSWVGPLQTIATQLFWALAGIQFCYALGMLAFRGADLSEILAELVTQILVIGIFFFLVQNSSTFANDVVNSFKQAATTASGTAGSNPTEILHTGINEAQKICDLMSITTPGTDIFFAIAAFIVVILMAFVAALAVMVNIEAYIIVSALVLFTGFGGSRWTKEYAMRSLTYAIAIGGKLFMLNLVVGIGQQIIANQSNTFTGTNYAQVMELVGVMIVLAAVVKQLPDMVASLLSGAALGTSSGLIGVGSTAAAATAAVATGGAGAIAGAAGAGIGAGQLASAQVAAGGGQAAGSRLANFANMTGRMASNMGHAAISDIGGRLAGTRTNRGFMGARMAADMMGQARELRNQPPRSPAAAPPPSSAPTPPENTISPS